MFNHASKRLPTSNEPLEPYKFRAPRPKSYIAHISVSVQINKNDQPYVSQVGAGDSNLKGSYSAKATNQGQKSYMAHISVFVQINKNDEKII